MNAAALVEKLLSRINQRCTLAYDILHSKPHDYHVTKAVGRRRGSEPTTIHERVSLCECLHHSIQDGMVLFTPMTSAVEGGGGSCLLQTSGIEYIYLTVGNGAGIEAHGSRYTTSGNHNRSRIGRYCEVYLENIVILQTNDVNFKILLLVILC